jgi:hypothetical protein
LEPCHGITYFAREAREEFTRAGLKGMMMAYLAGRVAPLGPVPPAVATAALYNFRPKLVSHTLSHAWRLATPAAVLDARLAGVDRALRRLGCGDDSVREAAELTRAAVEHAEPHGRPMFAANSSLPWPDEPHLALWHGATLIREHRGDGHATALLHEEVDGCEAHMLVVATGVVGRDWVRYRGWTDEDCAAAEDRLLSRGWLDDEKRLTASGSDAHERVERHTDRLAAQLWRRLGDDRTERLADVLDKTVATIRGSGVLPDQYPPIG